MGEPNWQFLRGCIILALTSADFEIEFIRINLKEALECLDWTKMAVVK